jgi:uncharacterized protein (DUF58 family)
MLLVALLVTAAACFGRAELVVLATPFTLALVMGTWRVTSPTWDVTLHTESAQVAQGSELVVSARLLSDVDLDHVELRLAVSNGLSFPNGDEVVVTSVTAGEAVDYQWRLRADRWGEVSPGQLVVRAQRRAGMIEWRASTTGRLGVRVLPSAGVVKDLVAPLHTRSSFGSHRSTARGGGLDLADLRPLVPGDSLRAVNWRASARHGDLIVNQYLQERSGDVAILLDAYADPDAADPTELARAVSAAASLVRAYLRARDRVGIIDLAGNRASVPAGGNVTLERLITELVRTMPVVTEVDRGGWLLRPPVLAPGTEVVALTSLADARFRSALTSLRRRGHEVTVVVLAGQVDSGDPRPDMDNARATGSRHGGGPGWRSGIGRLAERTQEAADVVRQKGPVAAAHYLTSGARRLDRQLPAAGLGQRLWVLQRQAFANDLRRLGIIVVEWEDGSSLVPATRQARRAGQGRRPAMRR